MYFMASSLSNHVDNLIEGIHKFKWKDCASCFKYESLSTNLIFFYLVTKIIQIRLIKI